MPHPDSNHVHHQDAARHHDLAAKAHIEAARLWESGKHEAAASHALIAHGHALQAVEHGEAAVKQHANSRMPASKA